MLGGGSREQEEEKEFNYSCIRAREINRTARFRRESIKLKDGSRELNLPAGR